MMTSAYFFCPSLVAWSLEQAQSSERTQYKRVCSTRQCSTSVVQDIIRRITHCIDFIPCCGLWESFQIFSTCNVQLFVQCPISIFFLAFNLVTFLFFFLIFFRFSFDIVSFCINCSLSIHFFTFIINFIFFIAFFFFFVSSFLHFPFFIINVVNVIK